MNGTDLAQIERDATVRVAKRIHAELGRSVAGKDVDELVTERAKLYYFLGRLLEVIDAERAE